jgi:chromosome segregation ATPase
VTEPSENTDAEKAREKIHDAEEVELEKHRMAEEKAKRVLYEAREAAKEVLKEAAEKAKQERYDDKREINGSYRWNRQDNGGNNIDKQKLEKCTEKIGDLEIGQAKREEQIVGLVEDVSALKESISNVRNAVDNLGKEHDARLTTLRELILEVRDTLTKSITTTSEAITKDITDYKSRNLWQLVLVMATALSTLIFIIINQVIGH